MASEIDLRGGVIAIREGKDRVALTKAETILSRDSKDVTDLLVQKLGRATAQVYYFRRDVLFDSWECISGPRGLPQPQTGDWPSSQRSR